MKINIILDHTTKIFILEDDQNRIDWFKSIFNNIGVLSITKQPGEALDILNAIKFDILFLDHDLEEEHYQSAISCRELPEDALTGLYVAKKLKETINHDTPCIIHSMNPVGAENMRKAHPSNTKCAPFMILKTSLEVIRREQC